MLAEGHCEITYGCKEFKYDGKEIAVFVEWTEKNIHDVITVYLQRLLTSKSVMPADIKRVQVVVGGCAEPACSYECAREGSFPQNPSQGAYSDGG